ncbi:MAG: hypothetical protein V4737_16110, partial [Curtobacterium sp.]
EAHRFGVQIGGTSHVVVRGGHDDDRRARILRLERLGLVAETTSPARQPDSKLSFMQSPSRRLMLTAHGRDFLDYVRSPLDGASSQQDGGA